MKSAYKDPKFSKFWHEISGKDGQTYKKYVVDPACFKLMGDLNGKSVLDLGCGNGYLGPKFLKRGAKKVILMDLSEENLKYARSLNNSKKVTFLKQDATKTWKTKSHSLDLIFSDMMLNEVKNIKKPITECYRSLKKKGKFIFAITHPAWDLFEYTKKLKSGKSRIIKGVGPYFYRGFSEFIMSTESLNPKKGESYQQSFKVEHYQRPLEDYFDAIFTAGFKLENFREPKIPKKVLESFPGYKKMTDFPIAAIFVCAKK